MRGCKLLKNIEDERHWLARAEETRVLAEMCQCDDTRDMMIRVSLGYLDLAAWAAKKKVSQ